MSIKKRLHIGGEKKMTKWACENCPSDKTDCKKCLCYKCHLQKKCPGEKGCIYDDKGNMKRIKKKTGNVCTAYDWG